LPLQSGSVQLDDKTISDLPSHHVPKHGIAYVPQGRGLFSELSVDQNLEIGMMVNKSPTSIKDEVLSLFPRLQERLKQRAETLSGGEQQMLAMARAMCIQPKVILLDEPTEGLQPSMIELIRQMIIRLREKKVAVLLVEQHVEAVLTIADRVAFVEHGIVPEIVSASGLSVGSPKIKHYLGV
jgi:branched-chain amino acid transport system ATP-binding protein